MSVNVFSLTTIFQYIPNGENILPKNLNNTFSVNILWDEVPTMVEIAIFFLYTND